MRIGALWFALLWIVGCTDAKTVTDSNVTAIEVAMQIDAGLGVTQLRISAVGDMPAFAEGSVPDVPRALAGTQTFDVLLPDALDGDEIVVRVDGIAGGTIVTSGGAKVTVHAHQVTHVDVVLGAPVVCGDGVISDPLETCDDGNTNASDGCSASCFVESGWMCVGAGPSTCTVSAFDVQGAVAITNLKLILTFSEPPNFDQATTLANYAVPGLTLSGAPFVSGNQVTLVTSSQSAIGYDVVVSNVTRASDASPMATGLAAFVGRTAFDVASARSTSVTAMSVTFDAAPDPTQATALSNYSVPGLTLSAPVLSGTTVSFTTSTQSAITYTLTVSNVTRGSDGEPLAITHSDFSGRDGFDIAGAISTGNHQIAVTFNATPNASQAIVIGNYNVPGLTLSGTPALAGNTVTIATSQQLAASYTVAVSGVTRATDGQPLGITSANFTGRDLELPTVTGVTVLSTNPNNLTTPYNTGTVTVHLSGTQFSTVTCPTGVKLDDRNGLGAPVNTQATSCTVDSDSQITATFPAGISTNGATGWNVVVTNTVGSNTTSAKLIPSAGLLISEVIATGGGGGKHTFIELYNPTMTSIDTTGVRLHMRDMAGMDTTMSVTFINAVVPTHRFELFVSSKSDAGDAWFAHRDATYTDDLAPNGSVYLSLQSGAQAQVIDKLGWGAQPAGGYEGAAVANLPPDQSVQRKPAVGMGAATDTDNNATDFNAPSMMVTPLGTVDPAAP
jgi:cysteine-rich repeat protein